MKIKLIIPVIILILILTLMPNDPSSGIAHLDKLGHMGMFFLFSTAMLFDFKAKDIKIKTLAAALLLGGAIEIIQPGFGRSFELLDLVFDMLGAGLGVLLFEKTKPILAKIVPAKTI